MENVNLAVGGRIKQLRHSHCNDKKILAHIQKAVDSSPELRSKKSLIEHFVQNINEVDDVISEWRSFVSEQKEKELKEIITSENLKEEETRKYISNCFVNGEVKTTGTDINKILPPVSRLGRGSRGQKRQNVLQKILSFFEKFFGIG